MLSLKEKTRVLGDTKRTIGFIINPIAGMGGRVGLKGTDGIDTLQKALDLGAEPIASVRAEMFLSKLKPLRGSVHLIVGVASMGEFEAQKFGFEFEVIGKRKDETCAEDTKEVVKIIIEKRAELLVFCGGDGTARDILNIVQLDLPILGVPTGVKMHSAVFAVSPESAAVIVSRFLFEGLPLRETEVMDVDEKAFRSGRVSASLYGYVLTPYEPLLIQGSKIASPITEDELHNQAAIAVYIMEEMEDGIVYIIGPGTSTRSIADLLDEKKTLLGVDLFIDRKIMARDVNEEKILKEIMGKKAKIIVTPIGGQGFIFGRGNQQISPKVIRTVGLENIAIIATKNKMKDLRTLRVDTGDASLDKEFHGYRRVVTDYREEHVVHVE
jgi:predicted polyphosphate/ATP-dependent NAD kinase